MPYKTQKLISQSELTLLTGVTSTMRQHKQEKGGGGSLLLFLFIHLEEDLKNCGPDFSHL